MPPQEQVLGHSLGLSWPREPPRFLPGRFQRALPVSSSTCRGFHGPGRWVSSVPGFLGSRLSSPRGSRGARSPAGRAGAAAAAAPSSRRPSLPPFPSFPLPSQPDCAIASGGAGGTARSPAPGGGRRPLPPAPRLLRGRPAAPGMRQPPGTAGPRTPWDAPAVPWLVSSPWLCVPPAPAPDLPLFPRTRFSVSFPLASLLPPAGDGWPGG